ncbi:MAG: cation:proton antiporter [Gammaproteobacteria bacterium]
MHATHFIQDLAVMMLIAGVISVLFHRLRQPVVLGYILAGVIIGPHTPPFPLITDEKTIESLAELGVVFLMFSLGLEFNLRKLRQVGVTAVIAALAGIVLMTWMGYEIGRFFGWKSMDALFLGAILAISSTTITIKALDELKLKHERFAQLIFGILIVEDILAIAIIALLSSLALSGSMHGNQVLGTLTRLSVFMVVSLVAGILVVPRLLSYVARFRSNEMLLVTVLGLCFGFCLLVIKLEYSVALGAFMIGAIIAEARQLKHIESLVEPLRDMFSAIFFVAIGLLLDPKVLLDYPLPIALITLAVVLGKVLTRTLGAFVAGNDGKTSLRVGMGLAQIGEFSFIIAALGISLEVTSNFLYPIAVAVSVITTLLTPYLIRASDPLADWIGKKMPGWLHDSAAMYSEWLQSIQPTGDHAVVAAMIWRIVTHVTVNMMLVAAAFLGMAFFSDRITVSLGTAGVDLRYSRAVLWAAALMLALPFLIAAYRKLKALAMLLAELGVRETVAGRHTGKVRSALSEIIPIVSLVLLFLLLSALSASLLPPVELLLAIIAGVAFLSVLLWRKLVVLHSKLQIALLETLKGEESVDAHQ